MKKGLIAAIVPALVLSLGIGTNSSSVYANENEIQDPSIQKDDYAYGIQKTKEFLTKYHVEEKVQKELIEKLENGEVWDSVNNQKTPIKTEVTQDEDGINETVSRFADGSVSVTTVEPVSVEFTESSEVPVTPSFSSSTKNAGSIGTFAVSPGTVSSGSGYKTFKKAKVSQYAGFINASFYANFTIVQGGNDYISNVYDWKVVTYFGTYAFNEFKITRKTESLSGKASAKLTFSYGLYNGGLGGNCWLKLHVGKDSYSSSYSY